MISKATHDLLAAGDQPGVGAAALRKMIEIPDPERRSREVWRAAHPERVSDVSTQKHKSAEIVDLCDRERIEILSPLDREYPAPLVLLKDFPPILYVKGNKAILNQPCCAVVGTREASHLGISWARQISTLLADDGVVVVSGLALGIDTAAHNGALKHSGNTVAVMAHGLDQITPTSNRGLASKILDTGGALVSEHPPGVPPRKAEFVRRNRLQSGMSVCSIVVESGQVGGAMHQARFTRDQQRDLFTVLPPSGTEGATEFNREGPSILIRELHARTISSREDIADLLKSGYFRTRATELAERAHGHRRLL